MSEVAYSTIVESVAEIIRNNENVQSVGEGDKVRVEVEEGWPPIADKCPWVGVFAHEYETEAEDEFIGGVTPYRTFFTIEIWCYVFALERKLAAQKRDRLLAKVKEVFKTNRQLNNTVQIVTFKPGVFTHGATKASGFVRGASLKIQTEVRE